MENTKLIKLLRTFSKDELRNFESFIRSPYFNNGAYLVKFFEETKKFGPKFSSIHFTKEKIFEKLQPSAVYNDAYMRKIISNLTKLADEFLIYNSFADKNNEKQLALLEQYRKRGLDADFEKLLNNTEKNDPAAIHKDNDFNLYRLYGNAVNYHLDRDYKKVLEYYQKEADSFLKYSVSKFLEMYGDMINSQHMYQANFKMPLLDAVLNAAGENNFFDDLSLKVTTYTLLIDLTQEHNYYIKLKEALHEASSVLSRDTELNAYLALINFGIRKAHSGESKYYGEIGEFYDKMLEKGVLMEGNHLSYYYFINIVTNRIRMKNFEAAEEFINKYSERLHPEDKDDIVNFCYARLNFYLGKFESALVCIARINLQQTHIKLEVKNYLLMIYYELDMTEEAYYIIDSYKHYIKRDETASDFVMNTNRNFLDSYSGLLKLKVSHKSDEIELLLKKIGSTETLNKQWLIDKGKELINKGA
ncbi:MAG: hypothetical protein HOP31_11510 [Ignavibacteria bacterium]|nr:hypothetical protein [Ignavibacteria bacterium]